MRGTGARVVPVWLVLLAGGCALPRDVIDHPPAPRPDSTFATLPPFTPTAFASDQKGDREKTLAYWEGLKKVLERRPKPAEFAEVVADSRKAVADVRALPALGVDPELLEHAEAFARYTDRFLTVTDVFKSNAALARRHPNPERAVLEAGQQALEVASQLRGLRGKLSNRYGTEFPAIKEPG